MTKLLDIKSGKKFPQFSDTEIAQMKNEITSELKIIAAMAPEEARKALRNLRFGTLRHTLLHLAAEFQIVEDVRMILDLSAQDREIIDARNADYFTAMHFAAINGNIEIANLLIEANANPNSQASDKKRKWTPIHYAAKYGNVRVLESLIFAGVNKETKTGFGLTPLIIASEFGQVETVEFLLSIGANKNALSIEENHCMNSLHYAVVDNHPQVAKLLLKAGIDRLAETNSGYTALDYAARTDNVEMVELMLKWGAGDIDVAYKVAQQSGARRATELIKNYLLARRMVFDKRWLFEHEAYLAKIFNHCSTDNVSEARIVIYDDIAFNPYGLLSLKMSFGLFSKVKKTFAEYAAEVSANQLPDAIEKVKRVAKIY